MGKQFTLYSGESYLEHCQETKMILFQSIISFKKALFWMFVKVLNTPLFSES